MKKIISIILFNTLLSSCNTGERLFIIPDYSSGGVKWSNKEIGRLVEPALTFDSLIVFTTKNKLIISDKFSGKIIRQIDSGGHSRNKGLLRRENPFVYGNTLFYVNSNRELSAIDLTTGKIKWEYQNCDWKTAPKVIGDKLICGEKEVVVLDINTGELKWKTETNSRTAWVSSVTDSVMVATFYSGLSYGKHSSKAISTCTGEVLWESNSTQSSPILLNDKTLLVYTEDNDFISLDIKTGTINWRTNKFATERDVELRFKQLSAEKVLGYGFGHFLCLIDIKNRQVGLCDIGNWNLFSQPIIHDDLFITENCYGKGYKAYNFFSNNTAWSTNKIGYADYSILTIINDKIYFFERSSKELVEADLKTGKVISINNIKQIKEGNLTIDNAILIIDTKKAVSIFK